MTGSIQTCNWKRHESSSLHTKNILQLITRRTWQADRCGFDEANGNLPKLLEESFVSSGRNNPLSGSAWTSDPWHRGNNWICLQWQLLGNYWIHFQIWSVSERTHQSHASKGKGHISYLSKTTIEELIQLLSGVVFKYIIRELKHYKCFSITVDSTPDITHIDQLTCIVRDTVNMGPVELFLRFLNIGDHSEQQTAESVMPLFDEEGINARNCCCGQAWQRQQCEGKVQRHANHHEKCRPFVESIR